MSRPLSILLAPFGSEGDVRPALWLAGGLAARGHRITFIITPYYRRLIAPHGWTALALGTAEDFSRAMRDPRLWQPRAGSEFILGQMVASLPRYAEVLDRTAGDFDLVVGTTLGTGALTWAEQRRIPRLLLHLQPMCLRSVGDCPVFLEGLEWLRSAPGFVQNALFNLSDFLLARKLLSSINAYRATCRLPPLRKIYPELWNGADGVAALFPEWYAPAQPDWPRNVRQFGFPYDPAPASPPPLPPELENFLTAGEPPILWTHGSANLDTEKFAAVATAVTDKLGLRGLLVGPAFMETKSSGNFLTCAHAPFERIFSRCRAVVHHGGIGTSVQALAAGVPQLVVPRAHDQPDNAARLTRLGVAARIRYEKFSTDGATEKLRDLLTRPSAAAACARFQRKIRDEQPLLALCDWAETLAG